jgi:hypothetical protein
MELTHNHNAKSQLAKLLAMENITVQHKADAKTAWFDVKNRILCLPVWREMSNDLYDLLVVHEVGHALDTPTDGWLDAIKEIAQRVTGSASNRAMGAIKGFLNVIEDARIDKRQKRRFPGARRNYVKGYAELIEKDFFGTKTRDINKMSFIDRLNIYCKGGAMLGIKFSAEEKKYLSRVEAAETFDEVMVLTEEIFRWSKENQQEQEQETGEDFGAGESDEDSDEYSEGDDDSDEYEDDEDGSGASASDDEDEDESEDGDGSGASASDDEDEDEDESDGKDESESGDGAGDGGSAKKKQEAGDNNDDDTLPESETEKAWQKNQEDLVVSSNTEYHYIRIPRPTNIAKLVIDYKQVLKEQRSYVGGHGKDWLDTVRRDLMTFKNNENNSISFMVKEFEMKKSADEYSRTSISKSGVIDTNRLHSYRYNDDLFRRVATVATGKNHGFVMFVDWSGSMHYNLKKTLRQLFSLAMFCKRVQIPFEVYTFRSTSRVDTIDRGGHLANGEQLFTQNKNEIYFDNLQIRNILSSRMKIQELNEAMYHLWIMGSNGNIECDSMGSTPLNECIGVADLVVNKFRAQTKVQIVNTIFLTDGDSDPSSSVHGLHSSYGKTQKYILQDEITKKSYDFRSTSDYYSPLAGRGMTKMLLQVLKDRTGCNLIGFYICGDGFDHVYREYNGYNSGPEYTGEKASWKDEGFFSVTSAGYDEYYILNPKMFDIKTNNLTVDTSMTKNKAAKEFIKFAEKKSVSRVLLSRFVKRIAA